MVDFRRFCAILEICDRFGPLVDYLRNLSLLKEFDAVFKNLSATKRPFPWYKEFVDDLWNFCAIFKFVAILYNISSTPQCPVAYLCPIHQKPSIPSPPPPRGAIYFVQHPPHPLPCLLPCFTYWLNYSFVLCVHRLHLSEISRKNWPRIMDFVTLPQCTLSKIAILHVWHYYKGILYQLYTMTYKWRTDNDFIQGLMQMQCFNSYLNFNSCCLWTIHVRRAYDWRIRLILQHIKTSLINFGEVGPIALYNIEGLYVKCGIHNKIGPVDFCTGFIQVRFLTRPHDAEEQVVNFVRKA